MELQPASSVFKVHRRTPELISPAKPTPRELKVVSDIDDQDGLRHHFRFFLFYRHNIDNRNIDPVRVIRKALSETLVYYYPFAGRLREGPHRKLAVECTDEGVVFVEADADVALDEFGDALWPPFPCREEFVSGRDSSHGVLNSPLLLMQVTRLKCGGFILGLSFNHVMCDGQGMCLFLKALGELSRGANAPSQPSVWDRHLLNARVPARVTHAHREYDETVVNTGDAIISDHMVQRSFFFGSEDISALRRLVPAEFRSSSTSFELLASLLWRCRTIALRPLPNTETRLICVVNARTLLHSPPVPPAYYGNVVALPVAIATVKDLLERPLWYALRLVQEAKQSVTDEYMKSMMDHLATRGRPHYAAAGTYLVSDLRRLNLDDIDFGWGKATYIGPAEASEGLSFFIRYMNKKGETGTIVPIVLPASAMERFTEELARVLDTECFSYEGSNKTKSIIQP